MKKRCLIVGVALLQIITIGIILFSVPIWLLVWFFTGFHVIHFWGDEFVRKPLEKYDL